MQRVHECKVPSRYASLSVLSVYPAKRDSVTVTAVNDLIERFHLRGQQLCRLIATKEGLYMSKEFHYRRVDFGLQHGRRFIVLGHQRLYRYPLASKRLLSDKKNLTCEYSRFFLFLAAGDVGREERLGLRNSILMT